MTFVALIALSLLIVSLHGAFQSSLVNVLLSACMIPLLLTNSISFTHKQKKTAVRVSYLCCISLTLQLLVFRYEGRPCLSYETNWGAAYLFVFFLYNDFLGNRKGKLFVIIASALMLSRMLILAIILYYFIHFVKSYFKWIKLSWNFVYIVVVALFIAMNFWFLLNVEIDNSAGQTKERVTAVNDESNKLRFLVNTLVINELISGNNDLIWGYGDVGNVDNKYSNDFDLMPHNELFYSIVEFGIIATLMFLMFSLWVYKKYFFWGTFDYYFPILICTLVLWARFMIIPSPEMFFILFLIRNKYDEFEYKGKEAAIYYS